MLTRFHKMHGLGNDFVVFDARADGVEMSPARARGIADRHTGVGCDQLIVITEANDADIGMLIFNADGGEVEACGNAARCVAQLVCGNVTIRTAGGLLAAASTAGGVSVDIAPVRFDWNDIPLSDPMDTRDMPVGWEDLERPSAINVGNPHVVFFVPDCDVIDLARLGPVIENDPLFPRRTNVDVATVIDRGHVRLRVWERGAGLTRACGTGACATAVAAIRRGLVDAPVTVTLPGGDLLIDWRPGAPIRLTGPATHVFTGEIDCGAFG